MPQLLMKYSLKFVLTISGHVENLNWKSDSSFSDPSARHRSMRKRDEIVGVVGGSFFRSDNFHMRTYHYSWCLTGAFSVVFPWKISCVNPKSEKYWKSPFPFIFIRLHVKQAEKLISLVRSWKNDRSNIYLSF